MKFRIRVLTIAILSLLAIQLRAGAQVQFASPTAGYPQMVPAYSPYAGSPDAYSQVGYDYGGPSVGYDSGVPSDCCQDCGSTECDCGPSRIWGQADYLLWWSQKRSIPPLVTTSPPGTAANVAGRLGEPTTSILLGNESVGDEPQSGFRLGGGYWLDDLQTIGIGSRFFVVGNADDDFKRSSGGDPILARPFYNVDLATQDSLLVAFPGLSSGTVDMVTTNEALGVDVFLRMMLYTAYSNRLDLIGGYQYGRMDDKIFATDSLTSEDPGPGAPVPQGTVIDTTDVFKAENDFHGGFIGFMSLAEDGRLTWRALAKVAFGNMRQTASVSGHTTTTVPGGPSSTDSFGLLAQPSNIGTVERDEFAIVPEVNVSVAFKATDRLELSIGYSFLHWSETILAGDLIDLSVDPTQTVSSPSLQIGDSDGFWYQGLNFGAFLRF